MKHVWHQRGAASWFKRLVVITAILSLVIPHAVFAQDQSEEESVNLSKEELRLLETYEIIRDLHVSGIEEKKLTDAAIKAMIEALNDPYTRYFTIQEWKEYNESQKRNYVGIGVRIAEDAKGIYIIEVFPGSPAEKAGLRMGDVIVGVDGKTAEGKVMDELVDMILGEEGTKVKLTVSRNGKRQDVEIVRGKITVPSITSMWLADGVAYVRISDFGLTTGDEFGKELEKLKKAGMKSLILDLRYNPGGYLHTVRQVAMQFIPEGVLIYTKDRNGKTESYNITKGKKPNYSVVVLVNGQSASGSEVLAGALQDYGIATIIGTKTYGKGSVQTFVALQNGGVMKITYQEYLTPKKHKVNGVGITPDLTVEGDVPQLLEALRTVNVKDFELGLNEHFALVNGHQFQTLQPILRKDGRIFVASRILAVLLEAPVEWNEKTKEVSISKSGKTFRYKSNTPGVVFQNGNSYIDLAVFAKTFPQLNWTLNGEYVMLSVKKGK